MVDLLGGSISLPCPWTFTTNKESSTIATSIPILISTATMCSSCYSMFIIVQVMFLPWPSWCHLTSIHVNHPTSPAIDMLLIWNREIIKSPSSTWAKTGEPVLRGFASLVSCQSLGTCAASLIHSHSLTPCHMDHPLIAHSAAGCGAASLLWRVSHQTFSKASPPPGTASIPLVARCSGLCFTCPSLPFAPPNSNIFAP